MITLQQQKDEIDKEALKAKVDADNMAFAERKAAADAEVERISLETAAKIKQIQYDAQK